MPFLSIITSISTKGAVLKNLKQGNNHHIKHGYYITWFIWGTHPMNAHCAREVEKIIFLSGRSTKKNNFKSLKKIRKNVNTKLKGLGP